MEDDKSYIETLRLRSKNPIRAIIHRYAKHAHCLGGDNLPPNYNYLRSCVRCGGGGNQGAAPAPESTVRAPHSANTTPTALPTPQRWGALCNGWASNGARQAPWPTHRPWGSSPLHHGEAVGNPGRRLRGKAEGLRGTLPNEPEERNSMEGVTVRDGVTNLTRG